ncbi:MAG: hypothetical protein WD080_10920 [Egibacteraceae bacterium]
MGAEQCFLIPPCGAPASDRPALDRNAAARFLTQQCTGLSDGLAQACVPWASTRVLTAHDASHPQWLALIAALQAVGDTSTAALVSTVYAFHGRVAGCLERGLDPRLSTAVCADVRALLASRLHELTEQAVGAVTSPVGADQEPGLV